MIVSVLLFFLGWSCYILIHIVQSRKMWTCDNIKSVFLYSGFKAVCKIWWNWEGMMKDNSHFCKSAFNHKMRKLLCWVRMRMCTLARSVCGQNTKWFVGIFDVLGYFLVHFLGILSVLPRHDLGFCLDHLQEEEKCLFWMWSCSVVLFCLQNFWLLWMVSGVWTISTRFGIWSRSSCHDLGLFPNHQMVPRRPKGPQTRSWGPEGPP